MSWGPVVVGVDASPAAAGAAIMGERIARLANVRCDLIHAARDAWAPLAAVSGNPNVAEMQRLQQAVARAQLNQILKGAVSERLLETLNVQFGRSRMIRKILGFAVMALVAILVLKIAFALLGVLLGLAVTVLVLAAIGYVFYLMLRVFSPATAQRVRDIIRGAPSTSR